MRPSNNVTSLLWATHRLPYHTLPLGDHLSPVTSDKIIRGKYTEVFILLFWEHKKRDRLPADNLANLKDVIASVTVKRKTGLLELQQMVGHLNFTCKLMAPERAFLRSLLRQCSAATILITGLELLGTFRMIFISRRNFWIPLMGVFFLDGELENFSCYTCCGWTTGFWCVFSRVVCRKLPWCAEIHLVRTHWCAENSPGDWFEEGSVKSLTFLESFPIVAAVWLWNCGSCQFHSTLLVQQLDRSPRHLFPRIQVQAFITCGFQFNIPFKA